MRHALRRAAGHVVRAMADGHEPHRAIAGAIVKHQESSMSDFDPAPVSAGDAADYRKATKRAGGARRYEAQIAARDMLRGALDRVKAARAKFVDAKAACARITKAAKKHLAEATRDAKKAATKVKRLAKSKKKRGKR